MSDSQPNTALFLTGAGQPPQDPAAFPDRRLLCMGLYQQLRKVRDNGGVLVANEGEHMTGNSTVDGEGRPRWLVSTWGESYRINCPFCQDTRHRLWINYRFGQRDPVNLTQLGTFYGICFNDDCLRDPENRAQLIDDIYGVHNRREVLPFNVDTTGSVGTSQRLGEQGWPGSMHLLTEMKAHERAIQYLVGDRRFGFETAEEFGLAYCSTSEKYPAAGGRIIAPIIQHGKMVGWQGRYVGDPPNKYTPKYYTMPGLAKRLVLYNIDRVVGKPFVVIFEGVTDVWRLPDYSVALLGKTLSLEQLSLLQITFRQDEPIVLCLDPETYDNCAMKIHEMMNAGRNPIVRARLPDGIDPADYDSAVLLGTILSQAAAAGIHIHI